MSLFSLDSKCLLDLAASEGQLDSQTMRERCSTAVRLGYDGIAIVAQANATLTANDKCSIAQIPLEAILSATQHAEQAFRQRNQGGSSNPYQFHQLTRLNIPIDDAKTAQASCSNSAVVNSYDLVAVQPQSERAFAQACTALDIDIISVDLSKRLPYKLKTGLIQTAIGRGIHFEILFAHALRDAASRRQLFANAQALTRETRGKNIIISSSARSAADLRAPYDVANLGTFFGLTEHQAKVAISKAAVHAVQHGIRRKAYRGTLFIKVDKEEANTEATGMDTT